MTKQIPNKLHIDLPSEVFTKALGRARSLGMSISEYMQSLVEKDVQEKEHDPWREPVPAEVDARWEKDIAETEEEEKLTGKSPKTYFNPQEYITDMQNTS